MIYRLTVFTVNCCAHFRRAPDRRLCSRRHCYAIIQLTPAMQLTPFMAGMMAARRYLACLSVAWFWGGSPPYWSAKNLHLQLFADYARFVLQFFATTPEHLIGLRILIGMVWEAITQSVTPCWLNFPRAPSRYFAGRIQCGVDCRLCAGSIAGHHFITESPEAWRWLLDQRRYQPC